jgi:hypothetical protein
MAALDRLQIADCRLWIVGYLCRDSRGYGETGLAIANDEQRAAF